VYRAACIHDISKAGIDNCLNAYYEDTIERPVEVRQILHRAILGAPRRLAEEFVHNKEVVRIQLFKDRQRGLSRRLIGKLHSTASEGRAYIMVLRCEDDNLVELGEIREEIVDSGAFCCAPSVLTLWVTFQHE
jgi:hypothetical protein